MKLTRELNIKIFCMRCKIKKGQSGCVNGWVENQDKTNDLTMQIWK